MDNSSSSGTNVGSNKGKKTIVVLGAGVAGLTTALKIQEQGLYQVEIIAEVVPSDPKTIKYTSHWAGGHYVSFSQTGTQQAEIDHQTFLEMWALSEPGGSSGAEECFLRLPQTEYFDSDQPKPNPLERMPGFQEVHKKDLFVGARSGFSFETVTIDVPVYLNYLASRFLEKGGIIIRGQVQHIDQVLEAGSSPFLREKESWKEIGNRSIDGSASSPDAVIVCAGLGARFLGGVEDATVYPARGQTVILRAPWVRFGRSFEGGGTWTYIIPRKSGSVVIGGTLEADDWYPKARPGTTQDLLKRALALCPELVPPETRIKSPKNPPEVEDLFPLVVEEACGLRPMRKGGPRIELEYMKSPKGKEVPVIHNYGHGTQGYIQSIGSANLVLSLLKEGLQRQV